MKNVLEKWKHGSYYLIEDDLNSFYTFFTVILAECSFLWAFQKSEIAMPLTLIMLGYIVNVVVVAWLKGMFEGTMFDTILSIIYVVVFVLLLIFACYYNMAIGIIFNVILFGATALSIIIRGYQNTVHCSPNKFTYIMERLFANKVFWVISQIIVIGVPFITFTVLFAQITIIPIALRIIVPVLYAIIVPFIATFEDDLCACNIFELIYEY